MRYRSDHKLRTRERILASASALFRRNGYAATGVDAVMSKADLTAGGFYAHFGSKRALLASALDNAFEQSRKNWPQGLDDLEPGDWIAAFAEFYLSEKHRDAPSLGCPMPSLSPEVSRNGEAVRRVFEGHLEKRVGAIAQRTSDRARAISAIALSVGGLVLARAVQDRDFSTEILKACRDALVTGWTAPEECEEEKGSR